MKPRSNPVSAMAPDSPEMQLGRVLLMIRWLDRQTFVGEKGAMASRALGGLNELAAALKADLITEA